MTTTQARQALFYGESYPVIRVTGQVKFIWEKCKMRRRENPTAHWAIHSALEAVRLNWRVKGADRFVSSSQTLARPRAAKGHLNSARASP